jgi:hypothetical protein
VSYLEKAKRALAAREKSERSEKSPQPDPLPLNSLSSLISHPEPVAELAETPLVEGPSSIPDLDSRTLAEHFGLDVPPYATVETVNGILADAMLDGRLDPKAVTAVHEEIVTAVRELEQEIGSGRVSRTPRLVRGKPLADWLSLDDVARLLRAGKR